MRIGISAPHLASTPRSGVGRYVEGIVGALLEIDRENEYVLISDVPFIERLPANARWEIVETGGRLERIWWNHRGMKAAAARLGLDALLATKTVLPRALPCSGVPVVHDLTFMRYPGQYPADFRLYWNTVMRGLASSLHPFVCVSEATARDVVELLGVAPERVHAVPSGIDATRFAAPPHDVVRARLRELGVVGPYILFVGNVIPRKNVPRLLEAATLAEVRLVVAGANLMDLRFGPGTTVLDEVSEADLPCLYAGAQLLAFPSLYEGFGFPILEAMAAGCPVVASGRGSMLEVGGGAMEPVDPEDVDSIAAGIRRALENGDRLRAAGRERVRLFDWRRTARATLDILESR